MGITKGITNCLKSDQTYRFLCALSLLVAAITELVKGCLSRLILIMSMILAIPNSFFLKKNAT